jgi:hypothetical protein
MLPAEPEPGLADLLHHLVDGWFQELHCAAIRRVDQRRISVRRHPVRPTSWPL